MRLLFVSNLFPDQQEPYRGLDNATLLHRLRDRAEIHTFALRPTLPWHRPHWSARLEDAPLRPRFVRASYIPRFGHRWNHRLYARAIRPALESLKQEGPFDAVLASWLYPDASAVARVLKSSAEHFVAIAQGTDVHHYLRIPQRRTIIVEELDRAASIITRSAHLARLLAEAGVPEAKLRPVYNGVDTRIFRPPTAEERANARAALGLPQNAPVILFVGNFLPVKNPALLLAAYSLLTKMDGMSEARLILVGAGPLESAMQNQISAAEAGANVLFAGRRDAGGVAAAMWAADVLALSSHNEGVPNVVLEAFACGLPVAATNVGGISEVISGEHLGCLVPPRDEQSFARALKDSLERRTDPDGIVAHGRTFSWENAAEAYWAALQPRSGLWRPGST